MPVIIIDPATGGIAGLYLDAYREVAAKSEVILVGAYASMSTETRRYFYPYSDLANGGRGRLGRWRMPVRYAELLSGLARSLFLVARTRPKAVFYALSTNLMPELLFIAVLRLFGIPVYVICHDVVPFVTAHEHRSFKDWQRRQFYRIADRLICHNKRSLTELVENYGQPASKLDYLPFPLMDLRPFASQIERNHDQNDPVRFLFIGHIRAEKGVNILIRAWPMALDAGIKAELLIAGQVPAGASLDSIDTIDGLTLINQYIEEADFVKHIAYADVVVFPYIRGTNSGVLSNVISLGKPVIVSDIQMFRESGLVPQGAFFATEDAEALAKKLIEFADGKSVSQLSQVEAIEAVRTQRIEDFASALHELLARIKSSRQRSAQMFF